MSEFGTRTPFSPSEKSGTVALRGITWSHTRGYLPLVATAQRFGELHPGIQVQWERRAQKLIDETPLEKLAADYDLVMIEHTAVGHAARFGPLVALEGELAPAYLADQEENSVGGSHQSYTFDGHLWALAIDAAAPVAAWREDLMARHGLAVPQTWDEALELARAGRVELPAAPRDCLVNFYSLCCAFGEEPFLRGDRVVGADAGRKALAWLRELISLCDEGCWSRGPAPSLDLLSSVGNTAVAYCPFAFGYSNYAKAGYAAHPLVFGEPPSIGGKPARTTLGGRGLALSASRRHRAEALAYAVYTASAEIQGTLYSQSGGQPGHRGAWHSVENNGVSGHYFSRTLPIIDRAYRRPRYSGHLNFQEQACLVVHTALKGAMSDTDALGRIDTLYRESLLHADVFS